MPVILVTAVPAFQTAWLWYKPRDYYSWYKPRDYCLWYKPRDYYSSPSYHLGLLRWLSGKESTCNAGDTGLIPGSGRSPGGGNGNPTPVFLPGKSHGQRRLVGSNPRGHKESGMTERLMPTAIIQRCDLGQVTETLCSDFLIRKVKIVSTLYGC